MYCKLLSYQALPKKFLLFRANNVNYLPPMEFGIEGER